MIKANELRIGNIIGWRDGYNGLIIGEVYEVHADKIAISPAIKEGEEGGQGFIRVAGVEPIPLTPEWLERMGFEYKDGAAEYGEERKKGVHLYKHDDQPGYFHFSLGIFKGTQIEIKYIHQLQNLYYALTGMELQIDTK